jgi:hypothetical protein
VLTARLKPSSTPSTYLSGYEPLNTIKQLVLPELMHLPILSPISSIHISGNKHHASMNQSIIQFQSPLFLLSDILYQAAPRFLVSTLVCCNPEYLGKTMKQRGKKKPSAYG